MVSAATPRGFGGLAVPPKPLPPAAWRGGSTQERSKPVHQKCWKEHAGQLVMTVKTGTHSGPRGR